MRPLAVVFVSRVIVPIWLIALAIQTVFSPKLALEIMDNHYKKKEQIRKQKIDQLAR